MISPNFELHFLSEVCQGLKGTCYPSHRTLNSKPSRNPLTAKKAPKKRKATQLTAVRSESASLPPASGEKYFSCTPFFSWFYPICFFFSTVSIFFALSFNNQYITESKWVEDRTY